MKDLFGIGESLFRFKEQKRLPRQEKEFGLAVVDLAKDPLAAGLWQSPLPEIQTLKKHYCIVTVTKSLASNRKVNRIKLPSSRSKGIGPSRTDSTRVTGFPVFNRNATRSCGCSV